MKQEEIKIRRLMQKCEDWLSDKVNDGTDNNKWWRLDQVLYFLGDFELMLTRTYCYSTSLHWMEGLNDLKNQTGSNKEYCRVYMYYLYYFKGTKKLAYLLYSVFKNSLGAPYKMFA